MSLWSFLDLSPSLPIAWSLSRFPLRFSCSNPKLPALLAISLSSPLTPTISHDLISVSSPLLSHLKTKAPLLAHFYSPTRSLFGRLSSSAVSPPNQPLFSQFPRRVPPSWPARKKPHASGPTSVLLLAVPPAEALLPIAATSPRLRGWLRRLLCLLCTAEGETLALRLCCSGVVHLRCSAGERRVVQVPDLLRLLHR